VLRSSGRCDAFSEAHRGAEFENDRAGGSTWRVRWKRRGGLQPCEAATGRVHVGTQTRRASVPAVGSTASGRSGPPSEVASALSPLPKSMPSSDGRGWTRHDTPRGRQSPRAQEAKSAARLNIRGVTRPRRPPRRPITTRCRRPEGPKPGTVEQRRHGHPVRRSSDIGTAVGWPYLHPLAGTGYQFRRIGDRPPETASLQAA
jgi:hypothetical protein